MQVVVTRRRTNERKSIEKCAMAERNLTDRAMFVKSRSVEAQNARGSSQYSMSASTSGHGIV